MKPKTLSKIALATIALALFATACGGSDSADVSSADQPVVDAIVTALQEEGDFPEETVNLPCMAAAMVTGLGGAEAMESQWGLNVDTIADGQDINDVELPKDQAISLADGMMDCGMMDAMVSEMTGDGMEADTAQCLADNLDPDVIRDVVASDLMSEADGAAIEEAASAAIIPSMIDAMSECDIDPSTLGL